MSVMEKINDEYRKAKGRMNKLKTAKVELLSGGGTGIEINLLLLAHSLEKGMGLPSPKLNFGFKKALSLLELLEHYVSEGRDINRYAFIESLSVLDAYIAFTDNDCTAYSDRLQLLRNQLKNKNIAGYHEIADMSDIYKKIDVEQIDYFIRSRHSIRSYEKIAVDDDLFCKVLTMTSYAPSACNRQPVKVYWSSVSKTVKRVNELIPGNQGFEDEIPNWAIVTADRKMFGAGEPLQWYVNGGIYLSYLVEALHAFRLGSCIFQIPATHKNTAELRRLAGIPDKEAVVAAVGFGYPKKENKFLAAARRPVNEILVRF